MAGVVACPGIVLGIGIVDAPGGCIDNGVLAGPMPKLGVQLSWVLRRYFTEKESRRQGVSARDALERLLDAYPAEIALLTMVQVLLQQHVGLESVRIYTHHNRAQAANAKLSFC